MNLGQIIKEYREKNEYSMAAFAEKSGISKAYISLLEKNRHPKTGKKISPSIQCIKQVADAIGMSFDDLFNTLEGNVTITSAPNHTPTTFSPTRIPVLGSVPAGIPIEAIQDIVDYEEIDADTAAKGEYFALKIKGDSMEPRICEGDVVIVRKQDDVESGDIAIVMVNGNDATIKRLLKYQDGIRLMPSNPSYDPIYFTNQEILDKPVKVIGKVIENRQKY